LSKKADWHCLAALPTDRVNSAGLAGRYVGDPLQLLIVICCCQDRKP
jgi:hypothetical protein